jgi:hypothetical protein
LPFNVRSSIVSQKFVISFLIFLLLYFIYVESGFGTGILECCASAMAKSCGSCVSGSTKLVLGASVPIGSWLGIVRAFSSSDIFLFLQDGRLDG